MKLSQEQQVTFDYLRLTFAPSAVVPLVYEGAIAGSEFLTYAATKLYFCLESAYGATAPAASGFIDLYNNANVRNQMLNYAVAYWNGAATLYYLWTMKENNYWFSRIIASTYNYMKFIGYKLTY